MRRTRNAVVTPEDSEVVPRGRTRWWLFAALATLPALVLLPLLLVFVGILLSDENGPGGGRKSDHSPCSEALAFGGATLPDGARPVGKCTLHGFQDTHYGTSFRMPRTGVQVWPAHTYPDAPAPETEFCAGDDVDLCLGLGHARGLPDGVRAHAVEVRVVYEDDARTALVRFAAFTT
ncbi:hypothetical protein GCM10022384_17690 [Streptomyces marokkonensis]|uniref:Uncharacterized protein n=1 Tax=Streptomyces marokkonensis TaxID=324855 RepID=A0ABP7PJA2_9ACTN